LKESDSAQRRVETEPLLRGEITACDSGQPTADNAIPEGKFKYEEEANLRKPEQPGRSEETRAAIRHPTRPPLRLAGTVVC